MSWLNAGAQAHYNGKFSIGAHGGVTLSNIAFTPKTKEKMLMGQMFGLQVKYWEERNFGLLAELNFEQGGWKENFDAHFFRKAAFERIRKPWSGNRLFAKLYQKCKF